MPAESFDLIMQDAKGKERILRYDPYISTAYWLDTGLNLDLPFPPKKGDSRHYEEAFPVSPTNPATKNRGFL